MASSVVDVGNGLILDEQCIQGIWAVEESLGYRFGDKRLLLTALTHRSFCNENNTGTGDFDELEWLGDSVLQLAVSSWLFRTAQGSRRSSGNLSLTRVRFVDAGACESFAKKLKLVSEEDEGWEMALQSFTEVCTELPILSPNFMARLWLICFTLVVWFSTCTSVLIVCRHNPRAGTRSCKDLDLVGTVCYVSTSRYMFFSC